MKIRGFIRWWLRDTLSDASFYAFCLLMAGMVMALIGSPIYWALGLIVIGFLIGIVDGARVYFRSTYRIYELEQKEIIRKLERKE